MAAHEPIETLYRLHASALRRYLTSRLGPDEAQDALQEVFLRLHRFGRFDHIDSPKAYLFRIASHVVSEKLTDDARNPLRFAISSLDLLPATDVAARALEAQGEVGALLSTLPPLRSAMLLLRVVHGYSYEEIAALLDISPHTVKTYLRVSRQTCRALARRSLLVVESTRSDALK